MLEQLGIGVVAGIVAYVLVALASRAILGGHWGARFLYYRRRLFSRRPLSAPRPHVHRGAGVYEIDGLGTFFYTHVNAAIEVAKAGGALWTEDFSEGVRPDLPGAVGAGLLRERILPEDPWGRAFYDLTDKGREVTEAIRRAWAIDG